jgi:GNAT superfamily N-acetyltransferase
MWQFLHWRIEWWDAQTCIAQGSQLEPILEQLFPGEDWAGFGERLAWRPKVCAVVARNEAGMIVGFKLAYVKEGGWLHSWLGGVSPDAQGQGLAKKLIEVQHEHAAALGTVAMTTSTRQPNVAMAIVNLKCGYVISGFEQAPGKPAIVHYFKSLKAD